MKSEQDTMITLPVLGNLTYREWHAFVEGVYAGAVDNDDSHDYTKEIHYWKIGFLCGRITEDNF